MTDPRANRPSGVASRRLSLRQFIPAVIVGLGPGHLREPAQRAEAVKLLDLLGMSLRQVILAVIVGVLLAALLLWLTPELVLR